ncbi:MAG: hypothetical protein QNL05_01905 [Gammaproteobacteria bacterium]|nr:hypothetical protein [Gammaproteobacteria bacterium]
MNTVKIKNFSIGKGEKLCVIAGPCLLENEALGMRVAEHMVGLAEKLGFNYVFKSSYEKDNRGAAGNHRGLGIDEGLKAHQAIGKAFDIPLVSDVHREADCAVAAEVLDILQIPAYLCQQTSLLVAAGETGKVINVKKGQFLAPEDMASAIDKLESVGNKTSCCVSVAPVLVTTAWCLICVRYLSCLTWVTRLFLTPAILCVSMASAQKTRVVVSRNLSRHCHALVWLQVRMDYLLKPTQIRWKVCVMRPPCTSWMKWKVY